MKKLSNLFEAVSKVDASKYPNLEFTPLNGSNPGSDSINDVLLQDLNTAAGNAKIKVNITTAVSGHDTKTNSGNLSRHTGGFAVDVAMVNGVGITKQAGDALVAELNKLGYQSVSDETPSVPKSILWQVKDHFNHVHISNTSGQSAVNNTSTSTTSTTTSTTPTNQLDTDIENTVKGSLSGMASGLGKVLNAATGLNVTNESKFKRISEQINRIKNLM